MLLQAKLKYTEVAFNDERLNTEINVQFGKENAVMHEIHRFLVTNRAPLDTAKLSVYNSSSRSSPTAMNLGY